MKKIFFNISVIVLFSLNIYSSNLKEYSIPNIEIPPSKNTVLVLK